MDTGRASLVFKIDEKLLQRRPPRLTLAGTLTALCKQIKSNDLEVCFVIDILGDNGLLPYMLGRSKNIVDLSLGRNTSASKIGDLIVSQECINGTYELCTAFLEFVLTALREPTYRDTTKSILASVIYIANEIYTNHQLWTYKNINDMDRILSLCTEIFHHIISKAKEPTNGSKYSELEIVSFVSLSQNQAHKQLIEVIVKGKSSIAKKVEELQLKAEESLRENPHVMSVRQSLFIFSKLLSHSRFIKDYCDIESLNKSLNSSPTTYQDAASTSSAPTTTIEKALFDTSIRPGLLQHLFGYIYQKKDSNTACLAVDLIKNIATKFSMSLMACLGSEADHVCEFFVDCLGDKDANIDLEVAILDLLSTCVKHQPGLIELFLNFKKEESKKQTESDSSSSSKGSLEVVMNLLKECRDSQKDTHKNLYTYLMKFILTFWQKHHSAIEQFDKAEEFWKSVCHPLVKFLNDEEPIDQNNSYEATQALNDDLISFSMMILAREIFCLQVGILDRKMNPDLRKILDDMKSKNLLGKYSLAIRRRYMIISENLDKSEDHNKLLMAWRDFLASFVKYKPFEIDSTVQNQIVRDILTCLTTELRLGERLDKKRITATGDALLLVWTKWMAHNSTDDQFFNFMHELLYLVDVNKEFTPFSFLLAFQTTLNLYLVRHRECLIDSKHAFDLLTPALQLMQFSLRLMEKYLVEQAKKGSLGVEYKSCMESRLCLSSITTTRFIIDVSKTSVDLWIAHLLINLKTEILVQLMSKLLSKRIGSEICMAVMELLLCLSTIRETADYLNKTALVNQVNMIVASAYEYPYVHLSQLAPMNALSKSHQHHNHQEQQWLCIYCKSIGLNISMMTTLNKHYLPTAVEYLSIHSIRICELFDSLRTKPRSVDMEEALQMIYLIDLVLRNGSMWSQRNRQSHRAIMDEIYKTAYTLATSALFQPNLQPSPAALVCLLAGLLPAINH